MKRACALCACWDRDQLARLAVNAAPHERFCLLGPFQVAKRADDFCFSFRPLEAGADARNTSGET